MGKAGSFGKLKIYQEHKDQPVQDGKQQKTGNKRFFHGHSIAETGSGRQAFGEKSGDGPTRTCIISSMMNMGTVIDEFIKNHKPDYIAPGPIQEEK